VSANEQARWTGRRAAADYLRQLLLKPGRYRNAWQVRVSHPRDGLLNQMAVAEVLASDDVVGVMPYQLHATVADALSGRQLTNETLRRFAHSFGFAEHEEARLQRLLAGSARISVLTGSHAVPKSAELELIQLLGPRKHETLSLHDHVFVGGDGRIERAHTLHVIEAIDHGVDRIPFLCDTNVLTLEVGAGGRELADQVRGVGDDVFFTEILLARTLELGDTIGLEYWLTYRFPGDPDDTSEREFRRAVMRRAANLTMRVEFHPGKLPSHVWWAHWDGVDGRVVGEEQVTLDNQHSAHRYLHSLDRSVAGFRWAWD
jgi:hypothetical protein